MILTGDAITMLCGLESESVQMCCTSPPYWGLRDYGVDGQLGLEKTPDEYVANMVAVFREVRRVLRKDGTLWLNLGDSYAQGGSGGCSSASTLTGGGGRYREGSKLENMAAKSTARKAPAGLKSKDLVGIPWMVAFALRADGWYLRSDIIWHKPNPMPESIKDRPTKSHEYIFLLAKSGTYFYDSDAIKDPAKPESAAKYRHAFGGQKTEALIEANKDGIGRRTGVSGKREPSLERNKRSVWTVTSQPFKGAHFATFPPKLIRPCILAGSRAGDTVLDPFNGAGTTGLVALSHRRKYIGIEINPEYVAMTQRRLSEIQLEAFV